MNRTGCAFVLIIMLALTGLMGLGLFAVLGPALYTATPGAQPPDVQVIPQPPLETEELEAVPAEADPTPVAQAPVDPARVEPLPLVEDVELTQAGEQLVALYERVTPGVVAISVQTARGPGAGSGFVIDTAQGHIVTNQHVVDGATEVVVTFFNDIQARAEIIGVDSHSDLGVIRVETLPEGVVALQLADSNLVRAGQTVVAIGNPFGQQGTMTSGIVSATGRTIAAPEVGFSIPLAIQTDASINPGNSGGPLLNTVGDVIGVNSQIRSPTGTFAGLGYAVPSNIVSQIVPFLIEQGFYRWAWLGVSGISVSLTLAEAVDLPVNQGAYVVGVVPNGPAAQAGLQGAEMTVVNGLQVPVGGDIIVAADGDPIQSWDDLLARIAFQLPGETISLTVIRDGQETPIDVILGERPETLQQEQQQLP
jgi:2-alkenal reductase